MILTDRCLDAIHLVRCWASALWLMPGVQRREGLRLRGTRHGGERGEFVMRTSGGFVRVGYALAALVLCGGAALGQEGEEKKKPPRKPRPKPVAGVVKSVDIDQKKIVVEVKDQGEKTFTCNEKTSITFAGGIMDGLRDGDTVRIMLDPKDENVARRVLVRRGGGEKEKPAERKKKRKKKDEADKPPQPAPENAPEDEGGEM